MTIHIGLIGDQRPSVRAHQAIPTAVQLAAEGVADRVELTWLSTAALEQGTLAPLSRHDAFWCVPGSPYESMSGALLAIRFAREQGYPFLGTCGGFQHALIEYARGVLGLQSADHAESNPDAKDPLITPLACSLVGVTGPIFLQPGSRIGLSYGVREATEEYHCSYGLHPRYRTMLESSGLHITAVDGEGEPRAVELPTHRFFVATLFQPELSAARGAPHPLIRAFVRKAADFQAEHASAAAHGR